MAKHSLWMTALLWVGITTAVQAQQRGLHELDSIANSVFTTNTGARAIASPLKMSLKSSEVLQADSLATREAFYIYTPVNKSGERFVIVSGDQRMPAILGYSDESNFDLTNMPDGLKWFLKKCEADAHLISQGFTETRVANAVGEKEEFPVIEPLLGKRAWGQDAPFNQQCPAMGGGHAKTGCVATALAQIMAYHRHPATYDWDNMPDSYDGNYTQEQAEAVAKLMHDIGEAVDMHYGASVSMTGDFNAEAALLNSLFDYDDNARIIKKELYTEDAWMEMLVNELRERRPIFYDGMNEHKMNAHAFVLDGLDANGYFHVNWGYEGDHNGYFKLNSLAYEYTNESGVPQKKDYSYYSDALIYIHPNDSIAEKDPTNIVSDSIRLTIGTDYTFNGTDTLFHRDTPFELSIFNFLNMRNIPFKGERQILLVDDKTDTLVTTLGKANNMKNETPTGGYYSAALKIKGTLPKDLPDGHYRIYAGVRQSGHETWGRVTALIWNKDIFRNYYLLILKDGYYSIGTGQVPDGIDHNTIAPHLLTLHQQEGALQFTPNTDLSRWDVISTHGTIAAQGGAVSQGEGISVETTNLPTGIYLLRGFGKDGQVYVAKFAKK